MSDIIALMGSKGSGKNTVADYIAEYNRKYDCVEVMSFAETLKDVVSDLFSLDRDLLEGDSKKSREWREKEIPYLSKIFGEVITPRRLLQIIGTDVMKKHVYEDIWVDSLLQKIHNIDKHAKKHHKNFLYVITDCRFRNEIEKLQQTEYNVKFVEIDRYSRNGLVYNYAYKYNTTKNPFVKLYCRYKLRKVHRTEWDWIGVVKDPILIYNVGNLNNLESLTKSILL